MSTLSGVLFIIGQAIALGYIARNLWCGEWPTNHELYKYDWGG